MYIKRLASFTLLATSVLQRRQHRAPLPWTRPSRPHTPPIPAASICQSLYCGITVGCQFGNVSTLNCLCLCSYCLRNLAPSDLMNMCQPVTRNVHRRRLRSVVRDDLIVPPTRTVRYGPRSFAVAGPSTWNALQAPVRNGERSAVSFRPQLKTELYMRT